MGLNVPGRRPLPRSSGTDPSHPPQYADKLRRPDKADRKETPNSHIITLDAPGMKRDDIKIQRGAEGGRGGGRARSGTRAERTVGKFGRRQFGCPAAADLDQREGPFGERVLKITKVKVAEEKKREPKVVDIVEERGQGQDLKASKAEI
ncbi:hypothetical protein H6P81_017667 [Aristolochia fimbriata]|uniref:SHSP domain-containing protein n=1 Tax=Aristolochia fimbriata TaxID=158543 RepID=A0AAV7E341_ARIFI|nr:hypothetical protein H6P81_017667 [Aristolochia fimbriata]